MKLQILFVFSALLIIGIAYGSEEVSCDIGDQSCATVGASSAGSAQLQTFVKSKSTAEVSTTPLDCSGSDAKAVMPLQMLCYNDRCELKALDVETGAYDLVYRVEKAWTEPRWADINSCSVNPIDSIVYCTLSLGALPDATSYLVRIDATSIAFVAKLVVNPNTHPNAASFDESGRYFWSFNEGGINLYAINDVSGKPGYDNPDEAEDLTAMQPFDDAPSVSDFAAVTANFQGSEETYLITLTPRLLVIKVTGDDTSAWQKWLFGIDMPDERYVGFGAAWNYQGHLYFSANTGNGVFRVMIDSIDLDSQTATFAKMEDSEATSRNDGLNCMLAKDPFPEVVCEDGECEIWGDPHIKAFDNAQISLLDTSSAGWHPAAGSGTVDAGDFWLVKNDLVHIQARYQKLANGNKHTYMTAVAVGGPFMKGNRFIVQGRNGQIRWNGDEILSKTEASFTKDDDHGSRLIHVERHHTDDYLLVANLPYGVKLSITQFHEKLNAKINMSKLAGGTDGQCGNFNGRADDDTMALIEGRVGTAVSSEMSLFFQ